MADLDSKVVSYEEGLELVKSMPKDHRVDVEPSASEIHYSSDFCVVLNKKGNVAIVIKKDFA
ncbi:MAG: hypothetical protein QX196_04100 [Methylococcaceae bacterium]|jgi:hypothetical protein